MKNFIQLFALLVLFTSCTIENDSYDIINEQENNIAENSYKTATITYDSNSDINALNELKEELKVQKIVKLTNNEEIWVMNNNEEISYLEDVLMFSDGVVAVEVVEGDKDGDSTGEEETEGDEERVDDSTGEEETEGDEERVDDSTGEEETEGDDERVDDSTGEEETEGDDERVDDSTGEEETEGDDE